MGTLISNPQVRASFNQQLYPRGLDLNRGQVTRCFGDWKANPGTSFRAGQPVMLDANRYVVLSDGTSILGIAKWDKITVARTLVVDAAVTFGTAGATKNLLPNIITGTLVVRSGPESSPGTTYSTPGDYTVNLTNGTITQVPSGSGGTIDPTLPVYVTYARTLTEDDLQLEGKNFWQSLDYVTIQDGRIAVIEAPAQVYTTEFDTAQVYTLTGATSNVYVNSSGLFTSVSSGNKLVGKVIGVPSNGDPYLGIDFSGQVVANT